MYEVVSPITTYLSGFMLSPDSWLIVGDATCYYTPNKGESWYEVPLFTVDSSIIYRIFFPTRLVGYLLGDDYLYRSVDGGNTWEIQVENPSLYTGMAVIDHNTVVLYGSDSLAAMSIGHSCHTSDFFVPEDVIIDEDIPPSFISSWKTDNAGVSSSTQVQLPLESSGTYNFVVDWGDGSEDTITTWNQAETTHTYSVSGTYVITITGQCYGWRFNNGGDRLKLLDISAWGIGFRLGNSNGYFNGCTNLLITATDILDLTGTTSMVSAFRDCTSLTTVPSMNEWNMSNITDMATMFFGTTLFNQDIGDWDVTSVTNMSNMFGLSGFNQDIGAWELVGNVNLSSMFRETTAFNQDLSNWNISDVSNISRMFYFAVAFDQDLGNWNVGSVTTAVQLLELITLSTENYDSLLRRWEAQSPSLQNGVLLGGGNSQYSVAAATARANLIANHSWTISDGGPA